MSRITSTSGCSSIEVNNFALYEDVLQEAFKRSSTFHAITETGTIMSMRFANNIFSNNRIREVYFLITNPLNPKLVKAQSIYREIGDSKVFRNDHLTFVLDAFVTIQQLIVAQRKNPQITFHVVCNDQFVCRRVELFDNKAFLNYCNGFTSVDTGYKVCNASSQECQAHQRICVAYKTLSPRRINPVDENS